MNYKHSCVIDAAGFYVTLVLALLEQNEDGETVEKIQYYILKDGESLLDVPAPSEHIKPHWNGSEWEEAATLEEIAEWEREHPAPPAPEPSPVEILQEENKLLKAQLTATSERQDFVEDCIAEMATQVYNV